MVTAGFEPHLCVVVFDHTKGPDLERWIGEDVDLDPSVQDAWSLIPYLALPDGAHNTINEEFSYFTLPYRSRDGSDQSTSVFAIACMLQVAADQLLYKPADVTRSAVQKAVVVFTDRPQDFSTLKEKLSVVTRAWKAQLDFRDISILEHFRDSLIYEHRGLDSEDQFFGLSLREIVHTYKANVLVMLKCLLLQPKMLFFGSNCEHVCQVQFSLLSLVPGLIRCLQDCAAPGLDFSDKAKKQDSVRTSDRASLMGYMGLPLRLFGKGAVFAPYAPLQQMDTLENAKSYMAGTTNSLILSQKEKYCDVLVNLDEHTVSILAPSLRSSLALSTADRRFSDFVSQAVADTWDASDPGRPTTHGYAGSEEFVRLQFEEYILALLSSVKYHQWLPHETRPVTDVHGDPSDEFGRTFIAAWSQTDAYTTWNRITDSHLFDIAEPKHPYAGGLTIDDVQRRLAAQVAEFHLDERYSQTKDIVGKRLADGRTQVASVLNKAWADIEAIREAQRKKSENNEQQGNTAVQSVQAASQKAGAYLSSWWSGDKRGPKKSEEK